MSELPQGWSPQTLVGLADFVMGQAPPGSECNKGGNGTPFVKAGEFGVERPVIREWTTRPLKHALASDVLICVVGATAGKINLGTDCAIGRSVAAIRPSDALDQHFLYRFLSTKVQELRAGSAGSAQGVISKDDLAEVQIGLPPLPEQRRIVAKIDSLTGKSKRARGHLDHIPPLVEKYKQAVLAAAFRGELTREWRAEHGVAADYRTTLLADVLTDIRYGTAKKCDYDGGATPVLRIPNVQKGEIALDDLKSADFEEVELRKLRLQPGDLLVIRSNGSLGLVGRSAIVNKAAAGMLFAGYLIRLRFDVGTVLPRYIHLWLQSASMRSIIEGLAKSTSGVNNINSTQIEQLPIKLTGLEEQDEIVRRIEVAFQWIDRLASEATCARRLIDRLDQAVLAKAVRGELVPQDPTDEPASILLERIRAERGAAPKAGRGRHRAETVS